MNLVAPFDGMAADYDRAFTASAVGKLMRSAVQRRLDVAFKPGERVLELNCGTGEDAIYLARAACACSPPIPRPRCSPWRARK